MHNLPIIYIIYIHGYSHYIYCLQEESTHFDLRVLTNFGLGIKTFCALEIVQEKLTKFMKNFKLYQFCPKLFQYSQSLYNFRRKNQDILVWRYQNIFSLKIPPKKID